MALEHQIRRAVKFYNKQCIQIRIQKMYAFRQILNNVECWSSQDQNGRETDLNASKLRAAYTYRSKGK